MTMSARSFFRDGLALNISDSGGFGLPVVFQHGLCGDSRQTAEVFPDDRRFRRLTLECRGHGASGAGDRNAFSIKTFADDVATLIETMNAGPLIVGGISMGAAISLRLAVKRPDLVKALVLARPAWIVDPAPDNMTPNAEVGQLIAELSPEVGRLRFLSSPTGVRLATEAPDNLASLMGFFSREPLPVTAALLQAIAADSPGVSVEDVTRLRVPTLVIGHGRDAIHPFGHAEKLSRLIPDARLLRITAKADDKIRYVEDFRGALLGFLEGFA